MKNSYHYLFFLCLMLGRTAAAADSEASLNRLLSLSLEDLMTTPVSISTSTKRALAKAPSVVSLVTAEDIKATGATNLVEVLQSIPGVYVRTNAFGFRPWITLRGAAGTHTLLMINGAPIKDMVFSSGMFWKGVPTSAIDRIEVIRGPGSALFGSDASTGVINIITKTAGTIGQSEAGARAGSFNTQEGWVQYGRRSDGIEINFTASLFRTDGYSPYLSADRQSITDLTSGTPAVSYAPASAHNGYDNQDIRFSVAYGPWRLQADYMKLSDVKTALTGTAVLDPVTRGGNHRYNVDLFYNNGEFARDWGVNAELRYLHLDYSTGNGTQERPPGYAGAYPQGQLNHQKAAENRTTLEASGLYSGFRQHALRIGGGIVAQDLYSVEQSVNYGTGPDGATLPNNGPLVSLTDTPYAFAPRKSRRIEYFFLQDIWTISPDWELTAGARYDRYSDFGGTTNPRVALVWQTTDRLVSKLMYGRAFVAPSYLQLYANAPGAAVGNPNLKPERSNTVDLSFTYAPSRDLTLGVDFYRFTQQNLIGQDPVTAQYQNTATASAHGIELEAKWQATPSLRLSGYASNRVEDYSSSRSYNTPKQSAYLRGDWAFAPRWNWNLQATRIGRHLVPASAQAIGAYTVVDTTVRLAWSRELEFAASVRNLFDTDAREYVGTSRTSYLPGNLPLPGRSFYAEARYRF